MLLVSETRTFYTKLWLRENRTEKRSIEVEEWYFNSGKKNLNPEGLKFFIPYNLNPNKVPKKFH